MEKVSNLLSNTNSVIAVVVGVVVIVGIIGYLISKGKLNLKSSKFSIESTKTNTKSLIAECRENCSIMLLEVASEYLDKYPVHKFQILYTCELIMNFFEKILNYNNITTNEDYLKMRWAGIKAIVETHKIPNVEYSTEFYDKLYKQYVEIIKQIVLLKKHYNDIE